jgi:nicotinate-nucleotide adenylyltransferase
MAPGRHIGLLGGSFNPPHVAHLMVAQWALSTQPVDEIWLLPAFVHPFGKALAPFEDRVKMCELAVRELRGAGVCAVEGELAGDPLAGKTARTLEHLVEKHPAFRFSLVVGADVLAETGKWYRWDRVRELAGLIVAGREGFEPVEGAPSFPAVSSTAIRERLGRGQDVSGLVPRRVLQYLRERGLYGSG